MNTSFKNSLHNETPETVVTYQCSICGKKHESVVNRAECEMNCYKKQEEDKRLAAVKKKQEEQVARKKEVDKAMAHANELKAKYIKDYGSYVYICDVDDIPEERVITFSDFFRMLP